MTEIGMTDAFRFLQLFIARALNSYGLRNIQEIESGEKTGDELVKISFSLLFWKMFFFMITHRCNPFNKAIVGIILSQRFIMEEVFQKGSITYMTKSSPTEKPEDAIRGLVEMRWIGKTIRVVIADDSRLLRRMVRDLLESSSNICVVGEASDGEETLEVVERTNPDVLLLDIVMPKKDGISVIKELMKKRPLPIVIFSSLTHDNADITLTALELGAVDFLLKPGSLPVPPDIGIIKDELIKKIRIAAYIGPVRLTINRMMLQRFDIKKTQFTHKIANVVVVIGASTGGPSIVRQIISRLPGDLPAAVLIVVHMPPLFTKLFAERLDQVSSLIVKEAVDGEKILTGHAYVAPGDFHMYVRKAIGGAVISLKKGPKIHGVRPALDATLESVADVFGPRTIAVVLTGMGCDGARGALKVKKHGGYVIAQDEASSIIYGMPKAVVDVGAADLVINYRAIPDVIVRLSRIREKVVDYHVK